MASPTKSDVEEAITKDEIVGSASAPSPPAGPNTGSRMSQGTKRNACEFTPNPETTIVVLSHAESNLQLKI